MLEVESRSHPHTQSQSQRMSNVGQVQHCRLRLLAVHCGSMLPMKTQGCGDLPSRTERLPQRSSSQRSRCWCAPLRTLSLVQGFTRACARAHDRLVGLEAASTTASTYSNKTTTHTYTHAKLACLPPSPHGLLVYQTAACSSPSSSFSYRTVVTAPRTQPRRRAARPLRPERIHLPNVW